MSHTAGVRWRRYPQLSSNPRTRSNSRPFSLINEPVRNANTSHPVRARRNWTGLPYLRSHCSAGSLLTCEPGGLASEFRSLVARLWDPSAGLSTCLLFGRRGILAVRPASSVYIVARRSGPVAYLVNQCKNSGYVVLHALIKLAKHKNSYQVKVSDTINPVVR